MARRRHSQCQNVDRTRILSEIFSRFPTQNTGTSLFLQAEKPAKITQTLSARGKPLLAKHGSISLRKGLFNTRSTLFLRFHVMPPAMQIPLRCFNTGNSRHLRATGFGGSGCSGDSIPQEILEELPYRRVFESETARVNSRRSTSFRSCKRLCLSLKISVELKHLEMPMKNFGFVCLLVALSFVQVGCGEPAAEAPATPAPTPAATAPATPAGDAATPAGETPAAPAGDAPAAEEKK